jgi:hypothetical protein
MTTKLRNPIVPKIKTESMRLHTIHIKNHIFTIQKNGTSVLSFRNNKDAIRFGKILESHYELTYEWPVVDFDETILYKKKSSYSSNLKYLITKQWYEDDLRDFCIDNSFGMIDVYTFEENDQKLVGNSFQWDVPMYFYVDGLNNRLEEE